MNTVEIVGKYLKENGYDGLVDADNECGCELSDLSPCGALYPDCEAGHKKILRNKYGWLIFPGKNPEHI